jgi:hypothetical protein
VEILIPKLKSFLEKYDPSSNLEFNGIKFRPGAKLHSLFGLTVGKEVPVQINTGVSTAWSSQVGWDAFSPFDFEKVSFLPVEESLILSEPHGFNMRLSPVTWEDLSDQTKESIKSNKPILKDSLICTCKNADLNNKYITMELISLSEAPTILDILLEEKYGYAPIDQLSTEEIMNFFMVEGVLPSAGFDILQDIRTYENIFLLNSYKIIKRCHIDGRPRRFYNPFLLFKL